MAAAHIGGAGFEQKAQLYDGKALGCRYVTWHAKTSTSISSRPAQDETTKLRSLLRCAIGPVFRWRVKSEASWRSCVSRSRFGSGLCCHIGFGEDTCLIQGIVVDKDFSHPQMPKQVKARAIKV